MPRAAPTLRREGAITLLGGYVPTDRIARPEVGSRCAVATDDGCWVVDLDACAVVTHIPAPQGFRAVAMADDETLCALGGDGVLRVHALPDGGCTAELGLDDATAIAGCAAGRALLLGDAGFRLDEGEAAPWRTRGGGVVTLVDLATGAVRFRLDGVRFAEKLADHPDAWTRFMGRGSVDVDLPWAELSPDGDRAAFALEVHVPPPAIVPGRLSDEVWSDAFTLDLRDPDAGLTRWAAPIEGYTVRWRDAACLTGWIAVVTGGLRSPRFPFVRRRIHRDGAVLTWRPPDDAALARDGAWPWADDLDDGRFLATVCAPRLARCYVHDPATGETTTQDLLADRDPATLADDARVAVTAWPDGALARALPGVDGRVRITLGDSEIGAVDELPLTFRAAGAWLEMEWSPPDTTRWRRGYARRG